MMLLQMVIWLTLTWLFGNIIHFVNFISQSKISAIVNQKVTFSVACALIPPMLPKVGINPNMRPNWIEFYESQNEWRLIFTQ